MRKNFTFFILVFLLSYSSLYAQKGEKAYLKSVAPADSLFRLKEYSSAASLYNSVFNLYKQGKVSDRYNAAICWALSNSPDSAFYQLNRIATLGNFSDYEMLVSDSSFSSLKKDKRWIALTKRVNENGGGMFNIENISDIKKNNL